MFGTKFTYLMKCCFGQEDGKADPSDERHSVQKAVTQGPVLVIQSIEQEHDLKFEITPHGIMNSKRDKQDGCTYAGSFKSESEAEINDIVLPEDTGSASSRNFVIRFDGESSNYTLTDLGEGSGTFVRIEEPYRLQGTRIASFGDTHMVLKIEDSTLEVKFVDGPKVNTEYTYTPEDVKVTVGRMQDCTIQFKDNSLSRYQCAFEYRDDHWVIMDGNGNRGSTNGTWLFADMPYNINDGMVFKAG